MPLLCTEKKEEERGSSHICMPAWPLMALTRQKGGKKGGGRAGKQLPAFSGLCMTLSDRP